jgi:hypothetical protein
MLRVSSLTVNSLAVFGKRSVVTVMSSEVETSLTISENLQRFLDFAQNDKWERAANASR